MYLITFLYLSMVTLINKNSQKLKLFIISIPLFLLMIFRYGVGADYFSYNYIYSIGPATNFDVFIRTFKDIDVGFLAISYLFKSVGIPYQLFISILGIVTLVLLILWIFDNSKKPIVSLLLLYSMFYLVWIFSALRQGLALSIVLYFFFNSKKSLSIFKKIVVFLVAILLHKSVIIVLPFMFYDFSHFNKKHILTFFILGIITTLLPIHKLLLMIDFLPFVERFLTYYNQDSFGFWDFGGIIRILLFLVVYIYYDKITYNDFNKFIVKSFLLGMSIYFYLKFAEVASARLVINFYFLILLIIPMLIHLYENTKLNSILLVCLLVFSGSYLNKELNTMKLQTGLILNSNLVPYTSIFNKEQYHFTTYYSTFARELEREFDEIEEFKRLSSQPKSVIPSIDQNYISVQDLDSESFILLNNKGNIIEGSHYFKSQKVFGQFIEQTSVENYITSTIYRDILNGKVVSAESIKDKIMDSIILESSVPYTHLSDASILSDNIDRLFMNPNLVVGKSISYFNAPIKYKILTVDYHSRTVYVYLDEFNNPIINHFTYSSNRMDINGFIKVNGAVSDSIYYFDGTKIWSKER